MIGTHTDALVAATLSPYRLAEGWTYLASGYSRDVYLSPGGVVYKVLGYDAEGDENALEFDNYRIHSHEVHTASEGKCRLAPCTLHINGVLAMEYVPEAEPAMYFKSDMTIFASWNVKASKVARVLDKLFTDTNVSNVWFDADGVLTMIDYVA